MYDALNVGYFTVVNNLAVPSRIFKPSKVSHKTLLEQLEPLGLPKEISLSCDLNKLGMVTSKIAKRHYDALLKSYCQRLPRFAAFANEAYHAAVISGNLFFITGIKSGEILDNPFTRSLTTFKGYIASEGAAYTAYNFESSLDFIDYVKKKFKNYRPSDLLYVLGLYWLNQAENKLQGADEVDFDLLGEAFECFELANGIDMWDAGYQCKSEEISQQRQEAAKKRHSENYSLKQQVIDFYKGGDYSDMSIEMATSEIFSQNLVPVAYRTIRDWISEFRKLQSASKA